MESNKVKLAESLSYLITCSNCGEELTHNLEANDVLIGSSVGQPMILTNIYEMICGHNTTCESLWYEYS